MKFKTLCCIFLGFCLFAPPAPADSAQAVPDFIRPSLGSISSYYGWRYGKFHSGLDIIDDRGKDVRAAESGTVIFSGRKKLSGQTIIIDHGRGWKSIYGHNLINYVQKGQKVVQGQKIGKMGASGRSTGVHSHFEIRFKGKAVNPLKYLK